MKSKQSSLIHIHQIKGFKISQCAIRLCLRRKEMMGSGASAGALIAEGSHIMEILIRLFWGRSHEMGSGASARI